MASFTLDIYVLVETHFGNRKHPRKFESNSKQGPRTYVIGISSTLLSFLSPALEFTLLFVLKASTCGFCIQTVLTMRLAIFSSSALSAAIIYPQKVAQSVEKRAYLEFLGRGGRR